jgi:hypothetical protein
MSLYSEKKVQNKKTKFYNVADIFKFDRASVILDDDAVICSSVGNIAIHCSLPYNHKKNRIKHILKTKARKVVLLI